MSTVTANKPQVKKSHIIMIDVITVALIIFAVGGNLIGFFEPIITLSVLLVSLSINIENGSLKKALRNA